MRNRALICLDSELQGRLDRIGLDCDFIRNNDVILESCGAKARSIAKNLNDLSNVLIVSSDDLDAINLAAAIKHDNSDMPVYLVVNKLSGSLRSRTEACGLNDVVDFSTLRSLIEKKEMPRDDSEEKPQPRDFDYEHDMEVDEPYLLSPYMDDESYLDPPDIDKNSFVPKIESGCWVMSVFSGSGGAGKSTVAALSAQLFKSLGYKTMLLDFDLQFGDLKNAFKGAPVLASEEVAKDISKLSTTQDFDSEFPVILSSPSRLELCEVVANRMTDIVGESSRFAEIIVINTGSCWSDIHADLLKMSSMSLFLIDQRVSSVRGCKHALDLASRLNISSQPFRFALNRCCKKSTLSSSDVAPAFGGCEVFELSEGGIDVEEKMCLGSAIDLVKQRNSLATSLFEMLKDVCPLSFDKQKEDGRRRKRARR